MKSKTNPTSKNTSNNKSNAQIERVKLDLLSLVSHELRTPLTSVLNAIRMLKEEDVSVADRQKFLDMAHRNAERLNSTLNQLLDLSKLVSGRLVCRFHEVGLRQLLLAQLENLKADAELLGYELSLPGVTKAVEDLPVILGDAPRLEQVIKSVFENALKFSPSGSKITLKVKQKAQGDDEFVVLELSNPTKEGASIDQKRLFKIFSQQEGVLDRAHEGVGGSLAIAAEVLRQHGGSLSADVEDGTFQLTLELPVLKSEQALRKVLESRMYALRTELGAISLVILEVAPRALKPAHEAIKAALFRASDTVYSLPDQNQLAVLMDDCKKSDAPKIIHRLIETVGVESGKSFKSAKVGLATCPEDATDPEKLLEVARQSLAPLK